MLDIYFKFKLEPFAQVGITITSLNNIPLYIEKVQLSDSKSSSDNNFMIDKDYLEKIMMS